MTYPIPQGSALAEIEIKKSRFIAMAQGIASREEGMAWLTRVKAEYADARHHCWAYVIGNPQAASNAGMGDDGEPAGTAGKPILNVLQHKGVGDIMLIVVRYFGGIKLGAGGLTRAYGQAAQAVMEVLPRQQHLVQQHWRLRCDFAQEQAVRHWIQHWQGEVVEVDYGQGVTLHLQLPQVNQQPWYERMAALGLMELSQIP